MKRQTARAAARLGCMIFLVLMNVPAGQAQHIVSAKAALIQHTVGEVLLNGDLVSLSKGDYVQMQEGQTLRTAKGRAELLLAPGVYLRLGKNSQIRLFQGELDDTQLDFDRGIALVEIVDLEKGNQIRMQFEGGLVEFRKQGLYRLDTADDLLRVYDGEARVAFRNKQAKVKKGKMLRLNEELKVKKFDRDAAADAMHQWAAARSFELFSTAPFSIRQPNWTHISLGWLMNDDYRVRIYSKSYYYAWMQARRFENGFPRSFGETYGTLGVMNAAAAAAQSRNAAAAAAAAQSEAAATRSGAAARSSGSEASNSRRFIPRQ